MIRVPHIRATRAALWVCLLGFGAILLTDPVFRGNRSAGSIAVFVLCALLLVGACAGLAVPNWRIPVLISIAVVVVELAAFEYYDANFADGADYRGNDVDRRGKLQVVMDLRQAGIDAHPIAQPSRFMNGLVTGMRSILPLGGVRGVWTVYCNESGKWVTYQSDMMGFRNPPGLWSVWPLDIGIVGDSYSHGSCMPDGESFADRIRGRFPATLNLGMSANGPLLELAGLMEYLPARRPKVVLWCFYEGNDLDDLHREHGSAILRGYFERGETQGLEHRQTEVDRVLRGHIEQQLNAIASGADPRSDGGETEVPRGSRVLLPAITARVNALAFRWLKRDPNDYQMLAASLERARATVASWGGQLVFVYLPTFASVVDDRPHPDHAPVIEIVESLGISAIDLSGPFAEHPDTPSLFPFRRPLHYNAVGHELVANRVIAALSEMGLARGLGRSLTQ